MVVKLSRDKLLGTNETNYDTVFGKMAVEQGLCTDEELRQSLGELKNRSKVNPIILKDLMIHLGYITESQAERLKKLLPAAWGAAGGWPASAVGKHRLRSCPSAKAPGR